MRYFFALMFVAGCGTAMKGEYVKEGGSHEEMQRDYAACNKDIPTGNVIVGGGMAYASMMNQCMGRKGWKEGKIEQQ
jgi:hypothetical protein